MHQDSTLIDRLGGTSIVAGLCGVTPPSVSEWRRKGIPQARLMYLQLLKPEAFAGPLPPDPGHQDQERAA